MNEPDFNTLVSAVFAAESDHLVGVRLDRLARKRRASPEGGILVGLAGPKGCGKSTITGHLGRLVSGVKERDEHRRRHPQRFFGFEHLRFAGPIKDMLRALGLTEAQVDGDEKELPCALLGGETPRRAMQRLGDWGRSIDPNLWVNVTMAKVDAFKDRFIVIDDVRFANEAEAIWERGGYIIELRRDGATYNPEHTSEVGLPRELIHTSFDNNGDPRHTSLAVLTWLATPERAWPRTSNAAQARRTP
jgi:energy-coupling factor transporter ATP-binding protein EcfA2